MKEVNVIIKADVQGSVEALASSLQKIEVEGVRVKIIHTAVGAINESDITLATASNATSLDLTYVLRHKRKFKPEI